MGYVELATLLGGVFNNETKRHMSGILPNGQILDNDFYSGGSGGIALIPEPTTLLPLGMGGLLIRKRK